MTDFSSEERELAEWLESKYIHYQLEIKEVSCDNESWLLLAQELLNKINVKNPYPKDIFPDKTPKEWGRFHKALANEGLTVDGYLGSWSRTVWNNCIQDIKSCFFDSERPCQDASVPTEDESKVIPDSTTSASVGNIPYVAIGNEELSKATRDRADELMKRKDEDSGRKLLSLLLSRGRTEDQQFRTCKVHNKTYILDEDKPFPCCGKCGGEK